MLARLELWACWIGALSATIAMIENKQTKKSHSDFKVNNREQCSKLCDYSSMCWGFTYQVVGERVSVCRLLSEDSLKEIRNAKSDESTADLYSRDTYEKIQPTASPCDPRECDETSFCFPVLGTRSFFCLPRDIDCGPFVTPSTMERTLTHSLTSYGSNVSVNCLAWYRNSDITATSVCRADSTWSPIDLVCEPKYCSPENVADGLRIKYWLNRSVGSQTNFACQYGWQATSGTGVGVCEADERWNVNLTCERTRCPDEIGLTNMEVISRTSNQSVFETEVTMGCSRGYNKIRGTGSSVCKGDGTWSPVDLECQIVECSFPVAPSNMHFKYRVPNVNVYLSEVHYECSGFYRKYDGMGNSTCDATGEWINPTLDCRPACLDSVPTPKHTYISSELPVNKFLGLTVQLACKKDNNYYYMSGKSTSECVAILDSAPYWSNVDIVCEYKCSRPGDPFPGTSLSRFLATMELYQVGDTVIYLCGMIVTPAQCTDTGWELADNNLCLLSSSQSSQSSSNDED